MFAKYWNEPFLDANQLLELFVGILSFYELIERNVNNSCFISVFSVRFYRSKIHKTRIDDKVGGGVVGFLANRHRGEDFSIVSHYRYLSVDNRRICRLSVSLSYCLFFFFLYSKRTIFNRIRYDADYRRIDSVSVICRKNGRRFVIPQIQILVSSPVCLGRW